MRYWWVNQNQTYAAELRGGYLWSPKRKANGHRNPFYEFMREVAPGDIVFSFQNTRIGAIGIATSYCYECPKPAEFGAIGDNWAAIGWKIDVSFRELRNPFRPKDHMAEIVSLLPHRYAPLRENGDGLQSVYLTEIPLDLALTLQRLIGPEAREARDSAAKLGLTQYEIPGTAASVDEWETRMEDRIRSDRTIIETERRALILARRGQGDFRARVLQAERSCRVTRVDRSEHLIASHMKPWRESTNQERLDGENGLALTPTIDHLFDKGFISFEDTGRLIVSPVAHKPSLLRMGLDADERRNVGAFSEGQRRYLEYHRENVLLMSMVHRT